MINGKKTWFVTRDDISTVKSNKEYKREGRIEIHLYRVAQMAQFKSHYVHWSFYKKTGRGVGFLLLPLNKKGSFIFIFQIYYEHTRMNWYLKFNFLALSFDVKESNIEREEKKWKKYGIGTTEIESKVTFLFIRPLCVLVSYHYFLNASMFISYSQKKIGFKVNVTSLIWRKKRYLFLYIKVG